MSDSSKAVFLSYASQDAAAALRICEALRAAGVEVWFDQSELVGGDAWDQKIRRHIKECELVIPVISAATQARMEGYFRLEWRLADQRTHLMAKGRPFLLPVVIDDTRDSDARVPDSFTEVQWTRLPGGETPPVFAARVKKLLSGEADVARVPRAVISDPIMGRETHVTPTKRKPILLWVVLALVVALPAYCVFKPRRSPEEITKMIAEAQALAQNATPKAVAETKPATAPAPSVAAQLTDRARALTTKPGFTRDDLGLADDFARQAIEADPTYAPAWGVRAYANASFLMRGFAVGDEAGKRGRDAEAMVNRARALAPDDVDALLALGLVQVNQGGGKAESIYRRVIALAPADNRARLRLSTLLRYERRYPEDIALAADAVRVAPRDPLAHYELALGFRNNLDFPAAKREIDASLALEPFDSAILLKAGIAYAEGDFAVMRQALEQFPLADRSEDRSVFVMMRAALIEHRSAEAITAAGLTTRDYLEDSSFTGPKAWLVALAYRVAGHDTLARLQWEEAERVLRKRLQADPQSFQLQSSLAITLAWLGRRDAAVALITPIEAAYREQPSFFRARQFAYFYAAMGDAARATPYIRESALNLLGWTSDPDTPATLPLDPWWDNIRDQPEFVALVRELKTHQAAALSVAAVPTGQPEADRSTAALAKVDEKSVAVLAFANLSDDKGNEYFSDGISEELLTVLQKIPGLHVAARTSSFYFKGKAATDQEIGEKLGVAHIVEGSVQKSGTRVKVTVHLSRAATGEEVWSESYTRELKDVFALQEELALAIVGELRGHLGGSGDAAAVKAAVQGGTSNPEAYQLYLQGQFHAHRFSEKNMNEALAAYQRAIDLDPNFALAWAGLGAAHAWITGFSTELDQAGFRAHLALALQSAQRALAIAPKLPEGLFALALIQLNADFDFKAAGETIRTGLALAPADPALLIVAGNLANAMGDMARADDFYHRAAALDPVNPTARSFLAFNLVMMGKHAEAAAEYARVVELNPAAPWAHAGLGLSLILQGKFEEGITEAQGDGAEWARLLITALGRFAQKRLPEADAALAALTAKSGDTAAYQIAEVHAFRGEKDLAFSWLERALRQRDSGLLDMQHDPLLANLEGDPRWPVFLAKMGMAASPLK